ncbi:hypothetical protein IQ274_28500 [Nostoc sp. LEGE 12447]|uniref:hypothetical protein n=1 Tax=Nostoc sp. LEGE 12447 TaxID=1828640 RepID=UPI0018846846|nr:hypothetical protein [Nostoc sp. LEGE 12447]MBE9002037.1 hypothetical protein [Nostoc sp. LEGE 12447]
MSIAKSRSQLGKLSPSLEDFGNVKRGVWISVAAEGHGVHTLQNITGLDFFLSLNSAQ